MLSVGGKASPLQVAFSLDGDLHLEVKPRLNTGGLQDFKNRNEIDEVWNVVFTTYTPEIYQIKPSELQTYTDRDTKNLLESRIRLLGKVLGPIIKFLETNIPIGFEIINGSSRLGNFFSSFIESALPFSPILIGAGLFLTISQTTSSILLGFVLAFLATWSFISWLDAWLTQAHGHEFAVSRLMTVLRIPLKEFRDFHELLKKKNHEGILSQMLGLEEKTIEFQPCYEVWKQAIEESTQVLNPYRFEDQDTVIAYYLNSENQLPNWRPAKVCDLISCITVSEIPDPQVTPLLRFMFSAVISAFWLNVLEYILQKHSQYHYGNDYSKEVVQRETRGPHARFVLKANSSELELLLRELPHYAILAIAEQFSPGIVDIIFIEFSKTELPEIVETQFEVFKQFWPDKVIGIQLRDLVLEMQRMVKHYLRIYKTCEISDPLFRIDELVKHITGQPEAKQGTFDFEYNHSI
ncbi:MAG: hypothetical protein NZO16_03640 [Deltaproteobacteria bacterium]|nr:hypothetical protein [Deltaproteobacteria bacterium]